MRGIDVGIASANKFYEYMPQRQEKGNLFATTLWRTLPSRIALVFDTNTKKPGVNPGKRDFDHPEKRNYDDFNEYFWNCACLTSEAESTIMNWHHDGSHIPAHPFHSKTFLEVWSYGKIAIAFWRVFWFHVLSFQGLFSIANHLIVKEDNVLSGAWITSCCESVGKVAGLLGLVYEVLEWAVGSSLRISVKKLCASSKSSVPREDDRGRGVANARNDGPDSMLLSNPTSLGQSTASGFSAFPHIRDIPRRRGHRGEIPLFCAEIPFVVVPSSAEAAFVNGAQASVEPLGTGLSGETGGVVPLFPVVTEPLVTGFHEIF
uniref:Uncharacterized protein n=1 Tax=Octactis speculum TaxID=3111310 RepID=A0A7S2GCB2_9STRA|mmetsp:Transcript_43011/g.58717  ORF Transcript_43011/g.58717 Transcript_43011/m.58717 type:complete len:318 (+) Transcript_43011:544-1497(+)